MSDTGTTKEQESKIAQIFSWILDFEHGDWQDFEETDGQKTKRFIKRRVCCSSFNHELPANQQPKDDDDKDDVPYLRIRRRYQQSSNSILSITYSTLDCGSQVLPLYL